MGHSQCLSVIVLTWVANGDKDGCPSFPCPSRGLKRLFLLLVRNLSWNMPIIWSTNSVSMVCALEVASSLLKDASFFAADIKARWNNDLRVLLMTIKHKKTMLNNTSHNSAGCTFARKSSWSPLNVLSVTTRITGRAIILTNLFAARGQTFWWDSCALKHGFSSC